MKTITLATLDMSERLFELARKCNATKTQKNKLNWNKQMITDFINSPNSFVLVCIKWNKIVGAIFCLKSQEFNKLHIENIFVDKDSRNNGIAEALINSATLEAKKDGKKYVCVLDSALNNYFEKLGFEVGKIFCWQQII